MMSLSRLIYLLLIFVASWSAYYLYEQSADDVELIAPSLEAPLFTGKTSLTRLMILMGCVTIKCTRTL